MREQAVIGLVGNKTERNGASEQREDYKHMKTVERISRFHRKVWKEKRTVMQMLVF